MATDSLKVLIVNNYTGLGGIPKAIAGLTNAMASFGHEVVIISQRPVPRFLYPFYKLFYKLQVLSLDPGKRPPLPLGYNKLSDLYELDSGIKYIPYTFSDKNRHIQKLRKQIKELNPDVCICPLPDGSQLVWAATLMGTGIPYIYSERTSPQAMENLFWTRKGRLAAMSGADAIHLLLPCYKQTLPPFLQERAHIIPNPINIPKAKADAKGQAKKTLLWLGRMQDEVKQCSLALDAFEKISKKHPGWKMVVAGDGPDMKKILAHAKIIGLDKNVEFLGNVENPDEVYSKAQAFCFSSKHEGLPNALLEAMSWGLPCVAFAGCDGMKDIIVNGKNGLLAPEMNADSLADTLEKLMGDEDLRETLGNEARESLKSFSPQSVYSAWNELIANEAKNKGETVMDKFYEEPFASMARMSSRARQEWAIRNFGEPMPDSPISRLKGVFLKIKRKIFGEFA